MCLATDNINLHERASDRCGASDDLSRVSVSFDESSPVPNAGLLPAAALAQRVDLAGLVEARLHLARHGANSGTKAVTVIGGMLAGGDSIDDTALLCAGASEAVFGQTRAPSTVGSWLRAFRWHNVRQLDAVLLGYHPQLAVDAGTGQVLFARLRGGNAGAARGAASFLTETVSRVRDGASGALTVRADSAFYSRAVLGAANRACGSRSRSARTARSEPPSTRSPRRRGRRSRTG